MNPAPHRRGSEYRGHPTDDNRPAPIHPPALAVTSGDTPSTVPGLLSGLATMEADLARWASRALEELLAGWTDPRARRLVVLAVLADAGAGFATAVPRDDDLPAPEIVAEATLRPHPGRVDDEDAAEDDMTSAAALRVYGLPYLELGALGGAVRALGAVALLEAAVRWLQVDESARGALEPHKGAADRVLSAVVASPVGLVESYPQIARAMRDAAAELEGAA